MPTTYTTGGIPFSYGSSPSTGTALQPGQTTSTSTSSGTSGLLSVSKYAEQLMHDQYAWGLDQFAKNSVLTDQVVGDLMNLYSSLTGVGGDLMNQYQTLFEPEMKALTQDANNYASTARIQQAMGAAQAGVNQEFNSQRNAALSDLQSFGIDPSSGRYASLDTAERTQQAAAQANEAFKAEQSTEATGRALRSEALQLGSVMPSQATAAYNAAQGSATAAENAKLANTQEGSNILGTPSQLGTVAQQYRTQQSNSQSSGYNPGGHIIGGGGGNNPDLQGRGGGSGGGGGYPVDNTIDKSTGPAWGMDMPTDPNVGFQSPGFIGGGGGTSDNTGSTNIPEPYGPMGPGTAGQEGSPFYGPATDSAMPLPADSSQGDTSQFDQPSYDDSGYAEGGAIPTSKSPSRGRVVDDIPARVNQTGEPVRLNAGEHVITRDAVKMKGRKFFDDINKKARGGAIPRSRAYA